MDCIPSLTLGNLESDYAVIAAGMATGISDSSLVAASHQAGIMPTLAASGMNPEELRRELDLVRERDSTARPLVNIMHAVKLFPALAKVVLKSKIAGGIVIGAGMSRDVFTAGDEARKVVIPVISSGRAAVIAVKSGARYLIIEGGKAGGHLGTEVDVWDVFIEVKRDLTAMIEKKPHLKMPKIILAGGILTGQDIHRALQEGAIAVSMGTRFALIKEAEAVHPVWKQTLVNAKPDDVLVIGGHYGPGSPTGYIGRVIRTPTIDRLLEDGVVRLRGKKTFKGCQRGCLTECQYRDSNFQKSLCIFQHLELGRKGDYDLGYFFSGGRVTEIDAVEPISVVRDRLCKEYVEASLRYCLTGQLKELCASK